MASQTSKQRTAEPNPNQHEWSIIQKNKLSEIKGFVELFHHHTKADENKLVLNPENAIQGITKTGSVEIAFGVTPRQFYGCGVINSVNDIPIQSRRLADILLGDKDQEALAKLMPGGDMTKRGLIIGCTVEAELNESPFYFEFGTDKTKDVLKVCKYLGAKDIPPEIEAAMNSHRPIFSVSISKMSGSKSLWDQKTLLLSEAGLLRPLPVPTPVFSGVRGEVQQAAHIYGGVNIRAIESTICEYTKRKGRCVTLQDSLVAFIIKNNLPEVKFVFDDTTDPVPLTVDSSVTMVVPNTVMRPVIDHAVAQAALVNKDLGCNLPNMEVCLQSSHMHQRWEYDPINGTISHKRKGIVIPADTVITVKLRLNITMYYPHVTPKSTAMCSLQRNLWIQDIWHKMDFDTRGKLNPKAVPYPFTASATCLSVKKEIVEKANQEKTALLKREFDRITAPIDSENEEIPSFDPAPSSSYASSSYASSVSDD